MQCGACGAENEAGRKFCGECGAPLLALCPSCGTANQPTMKFCGECGAALTAAVATPLSRAPAPTPQAERRLVTVMFADLVGFTSASEERDAEDTRELLTRYFDTSRQIVERYGGTVEKFIGDAVMAMWGAPTANEDDAERAVRAALDLVEAIPALHSGLAARAGLLTGEAAVTLDAVGQGMVAGDLVNTASRIQSAAEPGTVLVGDATRRASEAAIAYAAAGEHELKGKAQPVLLWEAVRVAAQRRGEGRAAGLEAPFVGRATELRLLKDLFHASADERRARLVSVVGAAGIGKSRLSWEFEKYIDGLAAGIWWHRGRCLSYGDGVAFWALAEMIRGRAKIVEDENPASATAKVRATLELHVTDPEERDWIEPRLLHLLGLTERTAPDREDLFAAWRRFFERLAEQGPLVMVFEDIHWADEGLVAFVDYLLDWARHHPIFVLTLARPEIADRHPAFPGATRSATTLPLEPLTVDAMNELLNGLVPNLPEDIRDRLRDSAEGIPLYAVETVRMLRDRGLLSEANGVALVAGDLTSFEVPETLHALIASRLDAVPEDERSLLQDASVLGKTFTRSGLAALSGHADDEIDQLVTSLIRKELLTIETDPFSPERGQLAFLQALVQRITYETIGRRDRRRRHLAAAQFLSSGAGLDPDEIAEVIASHYLDASEANPTAEDADDVRAEARRWFTRAAERAASLAASLEAQRAFERAADLAGDQTERGRSLARAGELAFMGGRLDEAAPLLEEAIAVLAACGQHADAAGAQVRLGELLFVSNRIEEGVKLLESALESHQAAGDEPAIAAVAAELGRLLYFEGRRAEAIPHVERALELSERLRLSVVVVQALINKALLFEHRPNESVGLMRQALVLADESGDERGVLRACMNLSYLLSLAGRLSEAEEVIERGIALARRRGDRARERGLATNLVSTYLVSGRWDDAERVADELPEEGRIISDPVQASMMLDIAVVALRRGDTEKVRELATEYATWDETAYAQAMGVRTWARTLVAQAENRHDDALAESLDGLRDPSLNASRVGVELMLQHGGDSALAIGSADALAELLELGEAAPIDPTPTVRAALALQRARLAVLRDDDDPPYAAAINAQRESHDPFWVATALLEHGEWLTAHSRADEAEPILAEARETFERLRVAPMLERLNGIETPAAAQVSR
jgi:class 3 adenylate cyclase/tetratricopeptide (TPR) repeat protein